jgi:uncharacterized alpha-E superfamily protein
MNRYMERAENYARFIRVNFNLILEMPPSEKAQWEPLLIATGDMPVFKEHFETPQRDHVLQFMSFDSRNPNAILHCLYKARENARSIREIMSREMWEHLNRFYLDIKELSRRKKWKMEDWQDLFSQVKMGSQLFYGIIDSTITRNEGWHFGRIGRFIERADKTSRFIDVKYFILLPKQQTVGSNLDMLQWSAVLKSVSAFNMYRQAFRSINPVDIVTFLVLDRCFPRSIYYCLRQSELSLEVIAGGATIGNRAHKLLGKLRADLEYIDVNDIFAQGLHEFLDRFQTRNNEVDDAIFTTYFALKPLNEVDAQ